MNEQSGSLRLFVAIPIPTEIKRRLENEWNAMRQQLSFGKWVHPEDLHITLKFLGDVPESSVAPIEAAMEKIAARTNPFPLRLQGAGTFGPPRSPRVLWAGLQGGLQGGLQALKQLQADVERQLEPLGYPAEDRSYSPHVTLARQFTGQAPISKEALIGAIGADASAPLDWTADRIVLYRSRLGRSPMYEPVRTVAFHAGG